jgi:hypothetical protein
MEIGPVVVRQDGATRTVSIREAIKLKSCISETSSDRDIKEALRACAKPIPSVFRTTRVYHAIESQRRKEGIFKRAKQQVIDAIGYDREFTIRTLEFVEVCREHGYNPSSLAGSLVKYGVVTSVGKQITKRYKRGHSYILVYRLTPPQH